MTLPHLHPEALFIIQSFILIGFPFALWSIPIIKKYLPLVVVQILLGILLGPSIMGVFTPEAFHFLFPKESLPILNGLAWMALILFGFLTGLHLDIKEMLSKGKSFMLISLSTLAVPAILGAIVTPFIMSPIFLGAKADNLTFTLGMAIAVGVTALPVLGAILMEMDLIEKPIGKKVLGYATVNDVLLWVLVSILIAMISGSSSEGHSGNGIMQVGLTIGLTVAFSAFMYGIVRPALEWLAKKGVLTEHPDNKQLVLIFSLMFLSALVTEFIGIHYLLGAFIFGAMIPKVASHGLHHALEKFVGVALLPFFFMLTGLKTSFDMNDSRIWVLFGVMIVVVTIGKMLGTVIPELIAGTKLPEALRLGAFMRTKGLIDVVLLNILLAGEVISPVAFSALLFTTVFTTATTKPMLMLIDAYYGRKTKEVDSEGALAFPETAVEKAVAKTKKKKKAKKK